MNAILILVVSTESEEQRLRLLEEIVSYIEFYSNGVASRLWAITKNRYGIARWTLWPLVLTSRLIAHIYYIRSFLEQKGVLSNSLYSGIFNLGLSRVEVPTIYGQNHHIRQERNDMS